MKGIIAVLGLLLASLPVLGATTGQTVVIAPASSGSSTVLDLGDDGTDESTGLLEIATANDTTTIATSPSADKLLLDFSQPWPMRLGDLIDVSEVGAGVGSALVSSTGPTWAPVDITTQAELTTHTSNASAHHTKTVDASELTTGTVGAARLGSGTADATTFLRGDQTWAIPGGASYTRTITVDSGGLGDYTSVKAAVDFAATQTRSITEQWLVLVYPGTYQEAPLTVPEYVHVQGVGGMGAINDINFSGAPILYPSATSGTFITLAGGYLAGVTVYQAGVITGPVTAVKSTLIGGGLHNIAIVLASSSATHAVVGYESSVSSTMVDNVLFMQSTTGVANTTHLLITGMGNASIRDCWFMDNSQSVPYAIRHTGSGHAIVYFTRIGSFDGSNYLTEVANTGTGTISVLATPLTEGRTTGTIDYHWQWRDVEVADDLTINYTPTTPADWTDPDPATVTAALDTLAARAVTADDLSDNSITDLSDVTAVSGNTTTIATTSGALTSGNLAAFDVSGNVVDSGSTGGAPAFSDVTSGTNTAAAMVVGTGGSLKASGSGTIDATGFDADGDGTRDLRRTAASTLMFKLQEDDVDTLSFAWSSQGAFVTVVPGGGGNHLNLRTSGFGVSSVRLSPGLVTMFECQAGGNCVTYGRSSDAPSPATCADSGGAGLGTLFISATTSYAEVTNSDPDGCTLTIGEPTAGGQHLTLALVATAGGVITLADTPGTVNIAADWTPGVGDTLSMIYSQTRSEWLQTGSSDN